jgi:Predicted permeases
MTIKTMIKKNKLLVIVAVIYLILFALMPDKATTAIKNSIYYLIEMFEVLPVIFLLTVVIEALVPKEWIIKHFGEKSGLLGNLLSLVLGSISAGPIYAAFPISKMLMTKGASVANIVIILSSWAVIKVPMLANEVKFLGISFMSTRWVLTVAAILIMAWLMGKMISKREMSNDITDHPKPKVDVNQDYCVGCGICVKMMPEVYELIDQKAYARLENVNSGNMTMIHKTVSKCPTQAITINASGGAE